MFDGYTSGPSTKDVTYRRRTMGRTRPSVKFILDTPFQIGLDLFLSIQENKQSFILMLSECLATDGIQVRHAEGDVDFLIVKTATEASQDVTVIGEDTDIWFFLCHHSTISYSSHKKK